MVEEINQIFGRLTRDQQLALKSDYEHFEGHEKSGSIVDFDVYYNSGCLVTITGFGCHGSCVVNVYPAEGEDFTEDLTSSREDEDDAWERIRKVFGKGTICPEWEGNSSDHVSCITKHKGVWCAVHFNGECAYEVDMNTTSGKWAMKLDEDGYPVVLTQEDTDLLVREYTRNKFLLTQ